MNAMFALVNGVLVTYEKGWPGRERGDGEGLTRHHQGVKRIS